MKFRSKIPPREFLVGKDNKVALKDCGEAALEPDEQITFVTPNAAQYDVTRKTWGFYATPSLNGRLPEFGLRAVLVRSAGSGRYYILLVEKGSESSFAIYREQENLEIVTWLDDTAALDHLSAGLAADR